jgi:hypothetical protein
MNKFFAPFMHLPMENGETGSEGNITKTPWTNGNQGKCMPSSIILTSETLTESGSLQKKKILNGVDAEFKYKINSLSIINIVLL